nr:MAG TPA: hypothetical protein [Caudoviricetes sp.]
MAMEEGCLTRPNKELRKGRRFGVVEQTAEE